METSGEAGVSGEGEGEGGRVIGRPVLELGLRPRKNKGS